MTISRNLGPQGASFSDHHGKDGDLKKHHFPQVDGNGFGNVSLLCSDLG